MFSLKNLARKGLNGHGSHARDFACLVYGTSGPLGSHGHKLFNKVELRTCGELNHSMSSIVPSAVNDEKNMHMNLR